MIPIPSRHTLFEICNDRGITLYLSIFRNVPEQCFCVWSENESDFAKRAFMCDLTCMCYFMTPHDFYTLTSLIGEGE